ncbi:MAG: WD40 repeat domain-containing protein [Pseudanabaena sp. ELA607]
MTISDQLQLLHEFTIGQRTDWDVLLPLLSHKSLRFRIAAYNLLRDSEHNESQIAAQAQIPYAAFERLHVINPLRNSHYPHYAMTPDGQHLIGCYADGVIHRFDIPTGATVAILPSPYTTNLMVASIAISHDGETLYAGLFNGNIDAINLADGTCTTVFQAPRQFADNTRLTHRIALASQGKVMVGVNEKSHKLGMIDLVTGTVYQCHQTRCPMGRLFVAADGRTVIYSGNFISEVWDIATGRMLYNIDDGRSFPVISPDGMTAISGRNKTKFIYEWNLRTGAIVREIPITFPTKPDDSVTVGGITPDGKVIIFKCGDVNWCLFENGTFVQRGMRNHPVDFKRAHFTPDGQYCLWENSDIQVFGIKRREFKFIAATANEQIDELVSLCAIRQHVDRNYFSQGATEEAVIGKFMAMGRKHQYDFTIDDLRSRIKRSEGSRNYYYAIGDARNMPWRDLNMNREDIDVPEQLPLGDPVHFPS